MKRTIRLGFIVPSSNVVVEPVSMAILSSITDPNIEIRAHFSRIQVSKIDLSEDANSQFSTQNMVAAAQLLADAHVDVISWAGTSSAWLGFDKDEVICKTIRDATGIPVTTCIRSLNDVITKMDERKLGMATPYTRAVNEAIQQNYNTNMPGYPIASDAILGLDIVKNSDFALVGDGQLDQMVTRLVSSGCKAIVVCCTNVRAAPRAVEWEKLHGIIVLDSVAITVFGMLNIVGIRPAIEREWGSIFNLEKGEA